MRDFRKLQVWHKAHQFALDVYKCTRAFPAEERFGLTSQLRRAAASVPANLAEGCGRSSDKDLARFVSIAAGSASEAEYHLLLAHDLGYLDVDEYRAAGSRVEEVKRMLSGFHRKLTPDR